MAKPKRTQALFEVINAHNVRLQGKSAKPAKATKAASAPRAGLIASSFSWVKSRLNKPQGPYDPTTAARSGMEDHSLGIAANLSTAEVYDSPAIAPPAPAPFARTTAPTQSPLARTSTPTTTPAPTPVSIPQPVYAEHHAPAVRGNYAHEVHDQAPAGILSSANLAPTTALDVDRDRQQISLRLNYSSAIVATVALIAVLTLAYLIGTRTSATTSKGTATTESLQKGPANPNVLDVGGQASIDNHTTVGVRTGGGNTITPGPETTQQPSNPVTSPTALSKQRVIGMNYVIVQSYPTLQEAKAASDILTQNNVANTIEHKLPDWSNWYSVVGLQPFDHTSNSPQYNAYIDVLNKISKKFAGTSQFKQFDPAPYRWRQGS